MPFFPPLKTQLPIKVSCECIGWQDPTSFWTMKLVAPSLAMQKGEHGRVWERRVSEPTHRVHTPFCSLFIPHQSWGLRSAEQGHGIFSFQLRFEQRLCARQFSDGPVGTDVSAQSLDYQPQAAPRS